LERRLVDLPVRLRVPILAGTLLVTVVLGWFLKDLRINADILSYLPEDDPVARINRYMSDRFGGSQLAIVALEADPGEPRGVFTPRTLRTVAGLTETLRRLEGVQYVTSLTTVPDIRSAEDWIEVGRLVDPDRLPGTEEELQWVRARALSPAEEYRGRLVSADGRATVLLCRLQEEADKAAIGARIRDVVREAGPEERVYFAGLPFQLVEISRLVLRDIRFLIPLAGGLIFLILLASFRSLRGVLLPLLAAALSTLWTLGLMSILGVSFSVVSNVIPVVLLAVGSAYGIHVINAFQEESRRRPGRQAGGDSRRLAGRALRRVAVPVILAAATTVAGFVSFIFGSYLTMIRDFGIFCGLGILFALLLSLTFIPAVLSLLPVPGRRAPAASASTPDRPPWRASTRRPSLASALLQRRSAALLSSCYTQASASRPEAGAKPPAGMRTPSSRTSASPLAGTCGLPPAGAAGPRRPAERLGGWVAGRPRLVLLAGGLLFLAGIAGIPWLRREVDVSSYFRPGTEIRQAEELLRTRFGGSATIQILVRGDLQEPVVLRELAGLQQFLARLPGVHNVSSILNLVRRMEGIIGGQPRVPETREQVGNLWFLLEGEESLSQMVSPDAREGAVQATFDNQNSRDIAEVVTAIRAYLVDHPSARVSFALGGTIPVHHRVDEGIRRSLIQSLAIALVLIFLCNLLLLRSATGALVGLLPVLFTLAVLFGTMGFSGIPLDVATVLIGSISLGIGIDYSIHILHRYREEMRENPAGGQAAARTVGTTGRAITINVLTVSLGFLTLLFGSLIPLRRFALLIAVTMASSGLAAVSILPAFFRLLPGRLLLGRSAREGAAWQGYAQVGYAQVGLAGGGSAPPGSTRRGRQRTARRAGWFSRRAFRAVVPAAIPVEKTISKGDSR
jgi:predicted RND superfamily exporter protein